MSASITQCPQCSTSFRVSAEQLAAHEGMVRCGRCSSVFQATEHLHEESDPQLVFSIAPQQKAVADTQNAVEAAIPEKQVVIADETDLAEPETLVEQILLQDEASMVEPTKPLPKRRKWPWLVGALLSLLVLLAQALYFFRVEIAAQLPGLKPALTSYCAVLNCSISLPKKADLMSIESSDLEADPIQSNVITLSASIRNRATHIQAYPTLELSLTDIQDKVIARRNFLPAEYLKTAEDEKAGLPGNREIPVKIRLDTADLKPAGYKLFLFYPK